MPASLVAFRCGSDDVFAPRSAEEAVRLHACRAPHRPVHRGHPRGGVHGDLPQLARERRGNERHRDPPGDQSGAVCVFPVVRESAIRADTGEPGHADADQRTGVSSARTSRSTSRKRRVSVHHGGHGCHGHRIDVHGRHTGRVVPGRLPIPSGPDFPGSVISRPIPIACCMSTRIKSFTPDMPETGPPAHGAEMK